MFFQSTNNKKLSWRTWFLGYLWNHHYRSAANSPLNVRLSDSNWKEHKPQSMVMTEELEPRENRQQNNISLTQAPMGINSWDIQRMTLFSTVIGFFTPPKKSMKSQQQILQATMNEYLDLLQQQQDEIKIIQETIYSLLGDGHITLAVTKPINQSYNKGEIRPEPVKLMQMIADLQNAINTYPVLVGAKGVTTDILKDIIKRRDEHHYKVKELAGEVFKECSDDIQALNRMSTANINRHAKVKLI